MALLPEKKYMLQLLNAFKYFDSFGRHSVGELLANNFMLMECQCMKIEIAF
jgi:hypothetical protein